MEGARVVWSPEAERTVRRLMIEHPPPEGVRHDADRLGAIFVSWDLWSCWFLRPCGEVVIVGEYEDKPDEDHVYADRAHVLSALSGLSRRYPEVASLLPDRVPGAVDCRCVGISLFAPGKLICQLCG